MHQTHTFFALAMTSLVIGSCLARSLPDSAEISRHRARRALGTMTLIQKELELALGRHLPQGCSEIGCELLNPALRRSARSISEQRMAEIEALLTLSKSKIDIAHGQVDPYSAQTRSSSDQRMAELQALIALSRDGGVGHGAVDIFRAGKKRRSYDFMSEDGLQDGVNSQRLELLRELLQKARS